MRFGITLLISVFCLIGVYGQEAVHLKLDKKIWDSERKRYYIRKVDPLMPSIILDTPLVLRNGDYINRYAKFQVIIQRPTEKIGLTYFSVFVAPIEKGKNLAIIVDRDNDFIYDDTVYTVNMQKDVNSWDDFYKRLPLITVDSIRVYNKEYKEEYKTIKLKIGVSKKSGSFFKSLGEIKMDNSFMMDLYTVDYYSSVIRDKDAKYEFAVALNPVTQEFAGYPGTSEQEGAVFFYKLLKSKDTSLNFVPIGLWNTSSKLVKNAMNIGSDLYKITSLSISNRVLSLEKIDKEHLQVNDQLEVSPSHRLSSLLSDEKFTLIEFGGSWCKPCQIILPKLKYLHKRYGDKINFVAIAVENDSLAAQKYHTQTGVSWNMFYENITCASEECLKNLLNVLAYPTLVLIDKDKKVVFRGEGVASVNDVEQVIKKMFE